jgi:DNA-binding GntR family transcriptional regulator
MPAKSPSQAKQQLKKDKLSNDSSVALVVEHTRQGILNESYPPDSKIQPKEIAERCGTSFIPVREALRILEAEGFIVFRHNRGAWVTPLSLADLQDIYRLRIDMESEAVVQSRSFDKAEIAKLNSLIEKMSQVEKMSQGFSKVDRDRIVKFNHDFHFQIYNHCDSQRRLQIIRTLWMHSKRYQHLSLQIRHDAAEDEHIAIVDALAKGDHQLAAEALRTHLRTTVNLLNSIWLATETTADTN